MSEQSNLKPMGDRSDEGAGAPSLSRRQLVALPMVAGAGIAVLAPTGVLSSAAQATARPMRPSSEDRFGIEDLFASYLWAYDCSDLEAFLELFTEDSWVVGRGAYHRGKAAIAAWFRYLLDIREKAGDIWLHEAGNHRFVRQKDSWIVYSYATHFNADAKSVQYGVRSLGYFVSEVVNRGGAWQFRRFSISHWDKTLSPWKKPLPWEQEEHYR